MKISLHLLLAAIVAVSLLLTISTPVVADEDEHTICVVLGGFSPSGSTKKGPFGVARTQEMIKKVGHLRQCAFGPSVRLLWPGASRFHQYFF